MNDDLIPLTSEQLITRAVAKLPLLSVDQVPLDDACPICLCPFTSILDGSVQNEGTRDFQDPVVAPNPIKLSGVTKLEGCGHFFCRLDLIEWICGRHGTCPTCRDVFLDVKPITDSDGESSDGDYIPPDEEDEEDEDDVFMDTEDDWNYEPASEWGAFDFSDDDMEDGYDIDFDPWTDEDMCRDNLGLSDGGSSSDSFADNDVAVNFDGEAYALDNARIITEEDDSSASGPSTSGGDSKS